MAKTTKDAMSDTFGSIAAIDTITTNFPTLISVDSLIGTNVQTSMDMIFQLLQLINVDGTKIVNLISKILSGELIYDAEGKIIQSGANSVSNLKASQGLLDILEISIKTILLANLKDMFGGCPIDPIIPDSLMMPCSSENYDIINPIGLELPLDTIDFFGLLKNCPTDDSYGNIFYFDNENLNGPNDTWKSMDFNSYLWFVINKGNISTSKSKNIWDNRCSYLKPYKDGTITTEDMNGFLSATDINGTHAFITKEDEKYKYYVEKSIVPKNAPNKTLFTKKQIIICEYQEQSNNNTPNVLRMWINADRYYKTVGTEVGYTNKNGEKNSKYYGINRTIFEFNYDYITSIKLYDSKTIVANVLNSLFSLGNTIKPVLDINFTLTQIKVEEIVNHVFQSVSDDNNNDNNNDNDYFSFSNEEYDRMIQKANLKQSGLYSNEIGSGNINYDEIINGIKKIGTTQNQTEALNTLIELASEKISNTKYDLNGDIKFKFDFSFIKSFINQCVTQIVMELMTPKLSMLYAVNLAVMGDVSDITGWKSNMEYSFSSIDNILKTLENLIISITKEVINTFMKELIAFLMEKLNEWIKLFSVKLAMETIKDYKDLITQLITTCTPIINLNFNGDGLLIDDIYQADIIPTNITPTELGRIINNKTKG